MSKSNWQAIENRMFEIIENCSEMDMSSEITLKLFRSFEKIDRDDL